jgi:hypothetical protein
MNISVTPDEEGVDPCPCEKVVDAAKLMAP